MEVLWWMDYGSCDLRLCESNDRRGFGVSHRREGGVTYEVLMYTPTILWWMVNPGGAIQSSCNGKNGLQSLRFGTLIS